MFFGIRAVAVDYGQQARTMYIRFSISEVQSMILTGFF